MKTFVEHSIYFLFKFICVPADCSFLNFSNWFVFRLATSPAAWQ